MDREAWWATVQGSQESDMTEATWHAHMHLTRTDARSFLFMAESYSIVYMYHNFFIHSSVNGYLVCFCVLAIVNSAAVNVGVHGYICLFELYYLGF